MPVMWRRWADVGAFGGGAKATGTEEMEAEGRRCWGKICGRRVMHRDEESQGHVETGRDTGRLGSEETEKHRSH